MDKEGAAKKEGWGWGENTYIASGIFPIWNKREEYNFSLSPSVFENVIILDRVFFLSIIYRNFIFNILFLAPTIFISYIFLFYIKRFFMEICNRFILFSLKLYPLFSINNELILANG